MNNKNTGFKRVLKAVYYSYRGLTAAFKYEAAFRQELCLTIIMLPLAVLLPVTLVETILMVSAVFLVLITELLNSAVEAVVDRIGSEYNELAGRAKDLGSAAVFIALVLCLFVWVSILLQVYLAS